MGIYLIIFSLCRFDSELNKVGSDENPKVDEENEATFSKQKKPINKRRLENSPIKTNVKTGAKKRPTTGSRGGRKRGSKNRKVSIDENLHGREVVVPDQDGNMIK